jgi:uncharacterized membrane protein
MKTIIRSTTKHLIGLMAMLLLGCGVLGFAISKVSATDPTFTTIDFPGAVLTFATDINNGGQIVGRYLDTAGITRGYLLSRGTFTSLTFPGAVFTDTIGINRSGDIVGFYSLTSTTGVKDVHGFLLRGGIFISFDFPGAPDTFAEGIDTNGDIVGFTTDISFSLSKRHGFLLSGGVFTSIDFPGAASTEAWRINDLGEIVGRYLSTTDDKWHLYRLSGGSFTAVADFPEAAQTAAGFQSHVGGLNSQGDITSDYCSSTPCLNTSNDTVDAGLHGFLLSGGIYTSIDPPVAIGSIAIGINDTGDIVGIYVDTSERLHGYLRTP